VVSAPLYAGRLTSIAVTSIDASHHTEDRTFMLPGDKLLHAHFDLARAKESNPPPAHKG
jgi:hypothetical protein